MSSSHQVRVTGQRVGYRTRFYIRILGFGVMVFGNLLTIMALLVAMNHASSNVRFILYVLAVLAFVGGYAGAFLILKFEDKLLASIKKSRSTGA